MKRRSFLGALAAIVAAPSVLLRLKPAPVEPLTSLTTRYGSGFANIFEDSPYTHTLHGLSSSTWAMWESGYVRSTALNRRFRVLQPVTFERRASFREWAERVG